MSTHGKHSGMYMRWMADNMWLFVPIQDQIQNFLQSLQGYPFQEGQALNAGNINYQSLKALQILKQITEKGLFEMPNNLKPLFKNEAFQCESQWGSHFFCALSDD